MFFFQTGGFPTNRPRHWRQTTASLTSFLYFAPGVGQELSSLAFLGGQHKVFQTLCGQMVSFFEVLLFFFWLLWLWLWWWLWSTLVCSLLIISLFGIRHWGHSCSLSEGAHQIRTHTVIGSDACGCGCWDCVLKLRHRKWRVKAVLKTVKIHFWIVLILFKNQKA